MNARLAALLLAASTPLLAPALARTQATVSADSAATAIPAAPTPAHNRTARRAARLYQQGTQQFRDARYELATQSFAQAAKLDPAQPGYATAAEVARNHAVTALIQAAVKSRNQGDAAAARAALAHALELNPQSQQAAQHLNELGSDTLRTMTEPLYRRAAAAVAPPQVLAPNTTKKSFHLHTDSRQTLQQVFKAYGVEATLDSSLRGLMVRFDVDDADFATASRLVLKATNSFAVPIDSHRVLVARDSREQHAQFDRQNLETITLNGLSQAEVNDIGKMAKELFDIQQSSIDPSQNTLTLRGPAASLRAFNQSMADLLAGHSQVILDVRVIQLAHITSRKTGAQLPQTSTVMNLASEESSIFSANAALIQQIIANGLASANDPLAILAILAADGKVDPSLFANGLASFGGGTFGTTLVSPGSTSFQLNLNSSDSRALDDVLLRLGDNEEGHLRLGERYPIQTSAFSNMAASASAIAGLTGAGTSSTLNSLLSSYLGSAATIPMVEYQDLGLTLKATPKILRSGDVALTLDYKLVSLAGGSINNVPVLANSSYSGVITVPTGQSVVMISELDKSQSRAVSGTPGLGELPGIDQLAANDTDKNTASLLILITPHIVRQPQPAGATPPLAVPHTTTTMP